MLTIEISSATVKTTLLKATTIVSASMVTTMFVLSSILSSIVSGLSLLLSFVLFPVIAMFLLAACARVLINMFPASVMTTGLVMPAVVAVLVRRSLVFAVVVMTWVWWLPGFGSITWVMIRAVTIWLVVWAS